ncbi:MAG: MmgE/PrpD family protein [Mycolicibacterium sp.]|uniref:MmgE/PrpD family protein n=1 Tax=Mycolicibacterium sp. TaxID=2320850 RepID=UPI003D0CF2A7
MDAHVALAHLPELVERLNRPAHQLPTDVQTRARWLVMDTLGCAVAGGRSPEVRAWLTQHHLAEDPYGTSPHGVPGDRFGPTVALSMGACWDEACEGHARAHGRPGVAALSAIWPQVRDLDWDRLISALVLGYEVGARAGAALRIGPGMHVDANWPALGAAAAAARAMSLDSGAILAAVNIAACQLPQSLYRPIETGDTARNTYLGHAAILGQLAAQAAAAGISAPTDAIDGYLQVTSPQSPASGEIASPGTFEILSGYFKPFAAVRHVHYAAQAALRLRPPMPEHIAAIHLWTYPEAITYCGIRRPDTPLQAQFSLSFGVAATLRWGRLDPQVYRSPSFDDALLQALERRVVIHADPAPPSAGHRWARLKLVMSDGSALEGTTSAVRGDSSMPWTEPDLTEKFVALCRGSLGADRARSLVDHILYAPLHAPVFAKPQEL